MITSTHNPRIQLIRALLSRRKEREQAGSFIIEGVRLAEEALQSAWLPSLVLYSSQLSPRGQDLIEAFQRAGLEVEEVAPFLMDSVAGTESPQGILAVLPLRELPLPPRLDFVLVADGLRDPGNTGAILRSAAAAGVQAVFLTPGSADAFAPKVLRSAMGAHFRLPILSLTWEQIARRCADLSDQKMAFYLAEAGAGQPLWQIDFRTPTALVIGAEAEGAGPEAQTYCAGRVSIPMPGEFESLNAAAAASILIFEVVRQRNAA